MNFSKAFEEIKKQRFVKRKVVKNDTVIVEHKKQLFHHCIDTGIRYPYVPTNEDLFAEDWEYYTLKI